MARYTEGVCKQCRREGLKLFLKGSKCESMACPVEKKPYPPGEHGRGRIRESEYLLQLRQKQRARRIYGVLEKQFKKTYNEAARLPGIAGENLLKLLELRLDNAVFRAGFATSRNQARQFVRHGHVNVDGKKVTIPAFRLKKGQVVTMADKAKKMAVLRHTIETVDREVPGWLDVSKDQLKAEVREEPMREQIDVPVREQLIVELYSK